MALVPWLEGSRGEPVAEHTRLGVRALGAALARPGRHRAAAFDLLAADALLTYACEAALESRAPAHALAEILDAVVGAR